MICFACSVRGRSLVSAITTLPTAISGHYSRDALDFHHSSCSPLSALSFRSARMPNLLLFTISENFRLVPPLWCSAFCILYSIASLPSNPAIEPVYGMSDLQFLSFMRGFCPYLCKKHEESPVFHDAHPEQTIPRLSLDVISIFTVFRGICQLLLRLSRIGICGEKGLAPLIRPLLPS
jgi:hypothetical protein